jgi:hypothetical protein
MDTASSEFQVGIGADPEVFCVDTILKRFTSAHDLIPGTKDAPHPVKNGAIQVDGVAAEFNIKPAYTAIEFAQYNSDVLKELRAHLPKHIDIRYEPSVYFDKYFFEDLPQEPKELGCNPDFNAYTGTINPRPVPQKRDESMRTGSGHIHIGWTEGKDTESVSHRWDCNYIVKALEHVLGYYLRVWDDDKDRKRLYGAPGACRYRTYGVEWRSPSNAWLRHPEIWEWLFTVVKYVVLKAQAGQLGADIDNQAYLPGWDHNKLYTRENLNEYWKKRWSDFPEMPELEKPQDTQGEKELLAVRIAASQQNVKYDINLDLEPNGTNEYSDPYEDYTDEDIFGSDDIDW